MHGGARWETASRIPASKSVEQVRATCSAASIPRIPLPQRRSFFHSQNRFRRQAWSSVPPAGSDWAWLVELQDGTLCTPFTGTFPFAADGEMALYGCAPRYKGDDRMIFKILTRHRIHGRAEIGTLSASTSTFPPPMVFFVGRSRRDGLAIIFCHSELCEESFLCRLSERIFAIVRMTKKGDFSAILYLMADKPQEQRRSPVAAHQDPARRRRTRGGTARPKIGPSIRRPLQDAGLADAVRVIPETEARDGKDSRHRGAR